jgi:hypothetical protein
LLCFGDVLERASFAIGDGFLTCSEREAVVEEICICFFGFAEILFVFVDFAQASGVDGVHNE